MLDLCRERGLTLATAESCTGGLIGARLTEIAGASDVFVGGVIAYSNERQARRARRSARTLLQRARCGLGRDCRRDGGGRADELGADVAVADTGIAGPGGGTPEKPVGLVFIAVDGPDGARHARFQLPGDRESVRARATVLALHMVRRALTRSGTNSRAARALAWRAMSAYGSSVALLLPADAVDALLAWQAARTRSAGRRCASSRAENLHVTLAFLGQHPSPDDWARSSTALRAACTGQEPPAARRTAAIARRGAWR